MGTKIWFTKGGLGMRVVLAAGLSGFVMMGTASAAEVVACEAVETSVAFLAEPWEEHTRRFADGDVRLAVLDLVEPAVGAFHLLVLSPPFDIFDQATCQVVSFANGLGYREMSLVGMQAEYGPTQGLILEIPVSTGVEAHDKVTLLLKLNQSTGELRAEDIGT